MKKIFIFLCFVSLSLIVGCAKEKPLELSGEKIYELVSVSTVEISAKGDEFTSTGTGFYIDTHGSIVTNYHVIEDCNEITVISYDDQEFTVNGIKGYDIELDIVVLSTDNNNSKPLPIRNNDIKTGETVYSLGSSLGLTGTFSQGIISNCSRKIDNQEYIQTTAPISNGNSGGPLIDVFGNVIGITTAGFDEGQNLNLAIPISQLDLIDTTHTLQIKDLLSNNPPTYDNVLENEIMNHGTFSSLKDFNESVMRYPKKFASPGQVTILSACVCRTKSDNLYLIDGLGPAQSQYFFKYKPIDDDDRYVEDHYKYCYRFILKDDTNYFPLTADHIVFTGTYIADKKTFINCSFIIKKDKNEKWHYDFIE